jgi:Zn-dependent protease with chaperone function
MKKIRKTIIFIILVFIFLFISGCGYFELSTQEEIILGEEVALEVESYYDLYRDKETVDRVNRIGQDMAKFTTRPFMYKFRVLDSDEVNAFALPGGYIYIYRGLLDMGLNDDQLAAIIGHEITHIEADHFAVLYERMKKKEIFYTIVVLATGGAAYRPIQVLSYLDAYIFEPKYSRENETECDMASVQMLIQSNRNPHEFSELFKMWEKEKIDSSWLPGWMSSHPDFITRIRNIEEEIALQTGPVVGQNLKKEDFFLSYSGSKEVEEEINLKDSFSFEQDGDILRVKCIEKSDIKEIQCYGLNSDQRSISQGRTFASPFSIELQKGKSVKYIIASVRYGNGDFVWDIIRI